MKITENRSERQVVFYIEAEKSPFKVTVSSFKSVADGLFSSIMIDSPAIGIQPPDIIEECTQCLGKAYEIAFDLTSEIEKINEDIRNGEPQRILAEKMAKEEAKKAEKARIAAEKKATKEAERKAKQDAKKAERKAKQDAKVAARKAKQDAKEAEKAKAKAERIQKKKKAPSKRRNAESVDQSDAIAHHTPEKG